MAARPVEWVMVVFYGPAAHKATYGRLGRPGYTKDYIQLHRSDDFVKTMAHVLSVPASETGRVPITFRWPQGSAPGDFVFQSADRPHLKWVTSQGAPPPWKMTPLPSDATSETIPGDPSHLEVSAANQEFSQIATRGAGQPYLLAVKLKDESRTFHLRSYLDGPASDYAWADVGLLPEEVRVLVAQTSRTSALAWSRISSAGTAPDEKTMAVVAQLAALEGRAEVVGSLDADTGHKLIDYLRTPGDGLFFDPTRNHDAWSRAKPLPMTVAASIDDLLKMLGDRFPLAPQGDAEAETLEVDATEVEEYQHQIEEGSYSVLDSRATTKTRGSAQRAFANAVKRNYGNCCAITGLKTQDFLIASHIVPWSQDQDIRLDPSNGICLSLLVDRAFERGYWLIADDMTIHVDEDRIAGDEELRKQLKPYHGKVLALPTKQPPRLEYLKRRRALIASG